MVDGSGAVFQTPGPFTPRSSIFHLLFSRDISRIVLQKTLNKTFLLEEKNRSAARLLVSVRGATTRRPEMQSWRRGQVDADIWMLLMMMIMMMTMVTHAPAIFIPTSIYAILNRLLVLRVTVSTSQNQNINKASLTQYRLVTRSIQPSHSFFFFGSHSVYKYSQTAIVFRCSGSR